MEGYLYILMSPKDIKTTLFMSHHSTERVLILLIQQTQMK